MIGDVYLGHTYFFLRRRRGRRRCQSLGLIEEQVLLLRASRLALGSEQLALERLQLLLEQIPLDRHHAQLTAGTLDTLELAALRSASYSSAVIVTVVGMAVRPPLLVRRSRHPVIRAPRMSLHRPDVDAFE